MVGEMESRERGYDEGAFEAELIARVADKTADQFTRLLEESTGKTVGQRYAISKEQTYDSKKSARYIFVPEGGKTPSVEKEEFMHPLGDLKDDEVFIEWDSNTGGGDEKIYVGGKLFCVKMKELVPNEEEGEADEEGEEGEEEHDPWGSDRFEDIYFLPLDEKSIEPKSKDGLRKIIEKQREDNKSHTEYLGESGEPIRGILLDRETGMRIESRIQEISNEKVKARQLRAGT